MKTLLNLERISRAYRKYTDADPQAPEDMLLVNMTFIRQSALDTRRKLQCVDRILRMSPSQLVDTAFKVYNAWEARKIKQAMVFLEAWRIGQRKKQDPKGKRRGPIGINQYAHC